MDNIFNTELSFLSKKAKQRLYANSLVGRYFKHFELAYIKMIQVLDKDGHKIVCHRIDVLPNGEPYKFDKACLISVNNFSTHDEIGLEQFDAKALEFFNV